MSHLVRQQIRELMVGTPPLIEGAPVSGTPEFEEVLQPDSFDLRIGVVVAGGVEKVESDKSLPYLLPPGEMAIIITAENVNIPATLASEVSARQSILNDGLLVLAAPHVDPGYSGPLAARVINLLDKPYRLSFGAPILTARFYQLAAATERPYEARVSRSQKIERALRESRDTFNRLFLREEDLVLKKELRSEALIQALQWLSLLIPAIAVVLPFSLPFFWELGSQAVQQRPELVSVVTLVATVLLLPLFVLYIRSIVRLWRLMGRR
ncbi:MAG: dCTP deaminase domain-containing protein [Candidatus Rokuibacteriota bacterium]